MTMPEALALLRYWRRAPPTHLLVAGLAGYEPREDAETVEPTAEEAGMLRAIPADAFDSMLARLGLTPPAEDHVQ